MPTLEYYMNVPYREVIEPSDEGGFVAYLPDLPGCITQGETREEAIAMLDDAKEAWLSCALQAGDKIPLPEKDEDFSGKFNLRLPKSMHRRLSSLAKQEGVSLNQMAVSLLAMGIGANSRFMADVYAKIAEAELDCKEGRVSDAFETLKALRVSYGL